MMYLLAIALPPLAVLLCGKPVQFFINFLLTCFYFPGAIHAIMVVNEHKADKRTDKIIKEIRKSS